MCAQLLLHSNELSLVNISNCSNCLIGINLHNFQLTAPTNVAAEIIVKQMDTRGMCINLPWAYLNCSCDMLNVMLKLLVRMLIEV